MASTACMIPHLLDFWNIIKLWMSVNCRFQIQRQGITRTMMLTYCELNEIASNEQSDKHNAPNTRVDTRSEEQNKTTHLWYVDACAACGDAPVSPFLPHWTPCHWIQFHDDWSRVVSDEGSNDDEGCSHHLPRGIGDLEGIWKFIEDRPTFLDTEKSHSNDQPQWLVLSSSNIRITYTIIQGVYFYSSTWEIKT